MPWSDVTEITYKMDNQTENDAHAPLPALSCTPDKTCPSYQGQPSTQCQHASHDSHLGSWLPKSRHTHANIEIRSILVLRLQSPIWSQSDYCRVKAVLLNILLLGTLSVVYVLPEVSSQEEATELSESAKTISFAVDFWIPSTEVSMQKLCCLNKFQLHTPHLNSIAENLQNKDVK